MKTEAIPAKALKTNNLLVMLFCVIATLVIFPNSLSSQGSKEALRLESTKWLLTKIDGTEAEPKTMLYYFDKDKSFYLGLFGWVGNKNTKGEKSGTWGLSQKSINEYILTINYILNGKLAGSEKLPLRVIDNNTIIITQDKKQKTFVKK